MSKHTKVTIVREYDNDDGSIEIIDHNKIAAENEQRTENMYEELAKDIHKIRTFDDIDNDLQHRNSAFTRVVKKEVKNGEPYQNEIQISSSNKRNPQKINIIRDYSNENENTTTNNNELVPAGQVEAPASFEELQFQMEDELEKRRREWEKDVEKMQREFFKLPDGAPAITSGEQFKSKGVSSPIRIIATHKRTPKGTLVMDVYNSKNVYVKKPDGSRLYKVCFNVQDYDTDEISVRVEGNKIYITAKHEEMKESGGQETRNFNRQMDIPPGVDPATLNVQISSDGVLSVEAPVNEEEAEKAKGNLAITNKDDTGAFEQTQVHSSEDPFDIVKIQYPAFCSAMDTLYGPESQFSITRHEHHHGFGGHTCHTSSRPRMHSNASGRYSTPTVLKVDNVSEKIKLVVDLGQEYNSTDIDVEVDGDQINVKAKHEESQSGGRKAKREYSRSYDSPKKYVPGTVQAVFDNNEGFLIVEASVARNRDHRYVQEDIRLDLPHGAKAVNVNVLR